MPLWDRARADGWMEVTLGQIYIQRTEEIFDGKSHSNVSGLPYENECPQTLSVHEAGWPTSSCIYLTGVNC